MYAMIPTTVPMEVSEEFKLIMDGGICSYLDGNFTRWFGKKVEAPFAGSTLRYQKLLRVLTDLPQREGGMAVIPALGGEKKAESSLTEIRILMALQAGGQDGVLLTNRARNIFYARDIDGVLRAVYLCFEGRGWGVYARSIKETHRWDVGDQVFSRN